MPCCGGARKLLEAQRKRKASTKKAISAIVKEKKWQKIRASLIGQWAEKPEWCCSQLRGYLGPIGNATNRQIRIVMNYLTGTGFRTGRIKHACISKIRSQMSEEIKKRKNEGKWV